MFMVQELRKVWKMVSNTGNGRGNEWSSCGRQPENGLIYETGQSEKQKRKASGERGPARKEAGNKRGVLPGS